LCGRAVLNRASSATLGRAVTSTQHLVAGVGGPWRRGMDPFRHLPAGCGGWG
jgi:hypothetical protein